MTTLDRLAPEELADRLATPGPQRTALVREAAEAGVAEGQAVFAQMLLDGDGIARDERAALGWFTKAAAQHHLMALNMVGRCYDLGWGTAPDKARAAECYRIAATRGLDWAMYNYATLLALGEGVPLDRDEALRWLDKAAALGNAKAINFVGSFAEDGWAGPRDMAKAADCYARAAAGGDFRGAFNHARMLALAGRTAEAADWIARAVARGNPRFVAQIEAWSERCDDPRLRAAVAAAMTASC